MTEKPLLLHLANVAEEARVAAGLTRAHVAVRVRKRNGREGVSETTVARFERGEAWPENPDAMLTAYGEVLKRDPLELWESAVVRLERI